MGKRKKQRAAKRRGRSAEQRLRHQARTRAEQLYDPGTAPELAAEILRELSGGEPLDPDVAVAIGARGGIDRLRAVAEAALARGHDPGALSLAADVALLDGRPEDAEAHASRALEVVDDPDLRLRLAMALAGQGRVAAAIDVLDAELGPNPGLERLQLARGRLLQRAEPDVVDRFLDRSSMEEFQAAVAQYVGASADRTASFADGVQAWIETGAMSEDELTAWGERAAADRGSPEARRLQLMAEWVWLMPVLADQQTLLEAFAADASVPEPMRQRAEDWFVWTYWGLWELDGADAGPGAVLTDLVTGLHMHADVPRELLGGVPRWSVLLGYLVPVNGVWRAGSAFHVASPVEARMLLHELLDDVMANPDEVGKEGRPMLSWARRVHDQLGPLWLPDAAEAPSSEAIGGLQLALRAFAPHLVSGLRAMRGERPAESSSDSFGLTVDDPDAAWQALAEHAEFEPDEEHEGLFWVTEDDRDGVRAYLELAEDGEIVADPTREDLDALLDLLRGLGHPATAEERPEDDEPPEPPIALPDLPAADLPAWLEAWPDEPLDLFDEITPRDAVREHEAGWEVEMLIRYLEHDADRRGVDLDTAALRTELGLEMQ